MAKKDELNFENENNIGIKRKAESVTGSYGQDRKELRQRFYHENGR